MVIRQMVSSDLDFALRCANAEGWLSETREVFETFLAYDRNGCFVAEHDSQRIGICVATRYKKNGFIGELIVIHAMRNRGFGKRLMQHAMGLGGDLPALAVAAMTTALGGTR